jgi:hypothetical protein
LHLTPLELTARIAALVPPPNTHRHSYFGVQAPKGGFAFIKTTQHRIANSQP